MAELDTGAASLEEPYAGGAAEDDPYAGGAADEDTGLASLDEP